MPPIIIIEHKLYHPHYQQILHKVKDRKERFNEHESIPYQKYVDVLFPYTYYDADTKTAGNIYVGLAHLTVLCKNENIFNQLRAINCNFNVESVTKDSLLGTALRLCTKDNSVKESTNILKSLLESETTDLNLYCSIRDQTALQYIATKGDAHIEIFKTIVKKTKEFTSDVYGASALTLSIQECQYKTVEILLDTEQGQAFCNQCRRDGTYPIQLACELLTDVTQGSRIITKILQCMDPEVYRANCDLFHALINPNPDCRLAYCNILLKNGADPNEKSPHNEPVIMQVVGFYSSAKALNNARDQENYKAIFSLLLEHNVDLLFKTPYEQSDFLEELLSSNARDLVLIVNAHAEKNANKSIVQVMIDIVKRLSQRPARNSAEKPQDELLNFMKEMRIVTAYEDVQRQACYFELMQRYTLAQTVALSELVQMFQCGRLTEESILKLIAILDKTSENKKYIPYLYREYLTRSITKFEFITGNDRKENNEKKVLNLFLCLLKLVQYLPSITDEEERDDFKLEINNIMQSALQIALLFSIFYAHRSLGKFIFWLDKIDGSYYDDETKLMLLQFKITHAYFSEDIKSFAEYYQRLDNLLPADHLLRRQYDYWQVELLFKKADDESVETLTKVLGKLERYNLDIKLTESFQSQLDARRKREAKAKKVEKQKQKAVETPTMTVDKKKDTPGITAANSDVSSSSSSSSSS
ncbi:MAG: ankyrin repeat domain-containing protein, partial [Gammaproteobacteria bacterium]